MEKVQGNPHYNSRIETDVGVDKDTYLLSASTQDQHTGGKEQAGPKQTDTSGVICFSTEGQSCLMKKKIFSKCSQIKNKPQLLLYTKIPETDHRVKCKS